MDTVQRPLTSLRSTTPDSSRRSCPQAPGKKIKLKSCSCLQLSLRISLCVLTGFRCWSSCCSGLCDGDCLCWTWRRMVQRVLWWCCCSGDLWGGCYVSTAAHVAALDGDGFRHVHTEQRAEGVWLRGAHTGHRSGLDPISTGYWALGEQDTQDSRERRKKNCLMRKYWVACLGGRRGVVSLLKGPHHCVSLIRSSV